MCPSAVLRRLACVAAEQARLAGEAGESTLGEALAASFRHLAQAKGYHSPEQEAQP